MAKKLPFKQNSAGRWINAKTGRFAKKADYLPFLEKKLAANAARSTSMKEYWQDIKTVKEIYNISETSVARVKYLEDLNDLKKSFDFLYKMIKDPDKRKKYFLKDEKAAKQALRTQDKYSEKTRKKSWDEQWEDWRERGLDKDKKKRQEEWERDVEEGWEHVSY
ncbi:MAG: hypothetical protein PHR17_10405 [Aminobacterium sp.]|nr:hypothetical protein [Aminobacterium sp.]